MDRGRGIYVHEADKENELEGRKCRRFVLGRERMDRRQAVVASKNQIQHSLVRHYQIYAD